MSKLGKDQFPSYREAGKKIQTGGQSSAICLQPQNRGIETPEHIKKYRKSFKEQHGVTIKHYGGVNDPHPDQKFSYGIATEKSEGVKNIMKVGHKQGVQNYVQGLNEGKYQSLKRQPLGHTIDRKYKMPEQTKQNQFKFGLATQKNKYDVKQTIYSAENMPQDEKTRQMYLKSHLDYDPGQQKKRPYDWNVDPTDFRFGKVAKNIIHDQMKQIIASESYNDSFPKTKLIQKNLDNFLDKKDDKLGKPANLGQKQLGPDHVYGMRIQGNQWNAGKCLKGQATEYEVKQDNDLGKCSKLNCTNNPKTGDENRVFGVPTIRYDIKKPEKPSLADPQNYADETTAVQLLFPKQFASFGVDDEDFNNPKTKQEIYDIFTSIGFQFKGNVFEAIFERAKVIRGTILNKVCCNSFKMAIYQMCG